MRSLLHYVARVAPAESSKQLRLELRDLEEAAETSAYLGRLSAPPPGPGPNSSAHSSGRLAAQAATLSSAGVAEELDGLCKAIREPRGSVGESTLA